jgi:hypothetical protein
MGAEPQNRRRSSCPLPVKMTGIGNSHITIKASRRRRRGLTRG